MNCKEAFLKLMGSEIVAAVTWKCSKTASETEYQIGWWWWLVKKEVRDEKHSFTQIMPSLDETMSLHCLFSFWSKDLRSYRWCNFNSDGGHSLVFTTGQSTVPAKDVELKIPQAEAVFPPKFGCCWHIGLKQISSPWGSSLFWQPERVYQIGVLLHCSWQQANILEGLELWSDFPYMPWLSTWYWTQP